MVELWFKWFIVNVCVFRLTIIKSSTTDHLCHHLPYQKKQKTSPSKPKKQHLPPTKQTKTTNNIFFDLTEKISCDSTQHAFPDRCRHSWHPDLQVHPGSIQLSGYQKQTAVFVTGNKKSEWFIIELTITAWYRILTCVGSCSSPIWTKIQLVTERKAGWPKKDVTVTDNWIRSFGHSRAGTITVCTLHACSCVYLSLWIVRYSLAIDFRFGSVWVIAFFSRDLRCSFCLLKGPLMTWVRTFQG